MSFNNHEASISASQHQASQQNESTFFYHSDEDNEVDQILQQSNRLIKNSEQKQPTQNEIEAQK